MSSSSLDRHALCYYENETFKTDNDTTDPVPRPSPSAPGRCVGRGLFPGGFAPFSGAVNCVQLKAANCFFFLRRSLRTQLTAVHIGYGPIGSDIEQADNVIVVNLERRCRGSVVAETTSLFRSGCVSFRARTIRQELYFPRPVDF